MPLYLYCYQNGLRQRVLFYLCNMTHLINRLTNAPSVLLHYPLKVFTIDNYKILPMLSPVIPIITINNHQYKKYTEPFFKVFENAKYDFKYGITILIQVYLRTIYMLTKMQFSNAIGVFDIFVFIFVLKIVLLLPEKKYFQLIVML